MELPKLDTFAKFSPAPEWEAEFNIDEESQQHIMEIVRDKIYSDKILAVCREYVTNAWDAHIEAGIPDCPIEVSLPTPLNPELVVRDRGRGLPRELISQIYIRYGKSTKRDGNTQAGAYGIGAKSGFAYSDNFTIISYHGGLKSTYYAARNETGRGVCALISVEETAETGMEIRIPVQSAHMVSFKEKTLSVLRYMQPTPRLFGIPAEDMARWEEMRSGDAPLGTVGILRNVTGWGQNGVCVMGCVPYPVDLTMLTREESTCAPYVVPLIPIGDAHVAATRESLEYTDKTIQALKAAYSRCREEALFLINPPSGWGALSLYEAMRWVDEKHRMGLGWVLPSMRWGSEIIPERTILGNYKLDSMEKYYCRWADCSVLILRDTYRLPDYTAWKQDAKNKIAIILSAQVRSGSPALSPEDVAEIRYLAAGGYGPAPERLAPIFDHLGSHSLIGIPVLLASELPAKVRTVHPDEAVPAEAPKDKSKTITFQVFSGTDGGRSYREVTANQIPSDAWVMSKDPAIPHLAELLRLAAVSGKNHKDVWITVSGARRLPRRIVAERTRTEVLLRRLLEKNVQDLLDAVGWSCSLPDFRLEFCLNQVDPMIERLLAKGVKLTNPVMGLLLDLRGYCQFHLNHPYKHFRKFWSGVEIQEVTDARAEHHRNLGKWISQEGFYDLVEYPKRRVSTHSEATTVEWLEVLAIYFEHK